MVYHKLEELIKNALEGQNLGNNTVVVRTTLLGEVFIEERENSAEERVFELENQVEDLKRENEELEERIEELEEKLNE